jgi:four helix bundle protein
MPIIHDEEFRTWESRATEGQRGDPVWRFHGYRVALFMLDRVGRDVSTSKVRRAFPFQTDQLLRAVGSISANVAEGLGRQSAAERARFFGIALGSLRESETWYHAIAAEFPSELVELRLEQLTELRKLLIGAQKWLNAKPKPTQLM